MLRALLQTYRVNSINNIRDGRVPPPSRVQAASSGWRAGPRVDSGACLVQPAPGRCPIRRRHGVEQAKSPSQTQMDCPTGRRGTGCTPMRLAKSLKMLCQQVDVGRLPKRKRGGKRALRLGLEPKWERFPIGGFAASFAENLHLLVLPQTGHTLFFVCCQSVCRRRSKQSLPSSSSTREKKENLSATHIAADGLITTTTTLEKRGASR